VVERHLAKVDVVSSNLIARSIFPQFMFVWSKLSGAQWMDAWEERFAGNPNLVIEYLKGGKSIRVRLFCNTEKEAKEVFNGLAAVCASSPAPSGTSPSPRPARSRCAM
jgi:ribosomal protein L11 methyltransferase